MRNKTPISEKLRIGGIILLLKAFFIIPILHFYLVAWPGQAACVAVSWALMSLAFTRIKPRTSDIFLLLYGEIVQFLSVGVWYQIAMRSREEVEFAGEVYKRSMTFSWDMDIIFFVALGGLFQAVLLFFYRNAVRYDAGWQD